MGSNLNKTFIEMITTRIIVSREKEEDILIPCKDFALKTHQGMPYLYLEDISEQVQARFGKDVIIIDVWYELDLNGYIYRYCKPDFDGWIKHGTTRGYA